MSLAGSGSLAVPCDARAAGVTEGDAAAGVRVALERAAEAAVPQVRQLLINAVRCIAEEERKIRLDPVATGSAVLWRVFGPTR